MYKSITCPVCRKTSYNPNDVREGYCGNCNKYTYGEEVDMENEYPRTSDGGFIIAKNEDFVIEVTPMIFNWRVHVALPELYGEFWERGYCYRGTSLETLVTATQAAEEWAKGDPFTTDPPGFYKRAF